MTKTPDRFQQLMRTFMQQTAQPMEFNPLDDTDHTVSPYGWINYHALIHITENPCTWHLTTNATLTQKTHLQHDSIDGNQQEIGIEAAPANCACGYYQNIRLRYAGTFTEILDAIFSLDDGIPL
jgi:hypothetical protein